MEVKGKEETLFFRHNLQLKDIKTGLAKSIDLLTERSGSAEVFTMTIESPNVHLKWVPARSNCLPTNAVVISHNEGGEEIFLGKFREVKRGYGYVFKLNGLLFESEFYEDFVILCHFHIKIT